MKFPHVLGRDFSGVVSALGPAVDDLTIGDPVFGVFPAGQEGGYAEKVAVKAAIVAKKPERMSHVEAAALALKNTLGLVCDPVGGLVEVPCVKRNALFAVHGLTAAQLALAGIESVIPMDEVVEAMVRIGS